MTYPTHALQTGKCNALQLGFLKTLGWKVENAWVVRGDNPVMVCSHDRYTFSIVDPRYTPDTKKDEYAQAWLDN